MSVARITTPLKTHGGKHYLAERIVSLMPDHVHYLEAFAGGLSVLFAKDPRGTSEVVNDTRGDLTTFWRVLQDDDLFARFQRRITATPFSQAEFRDAAGGLCADPVDIAARFFIRCRQSRQGLGRDFATLSRNRTRRGMNEQASAWLSAVEGLPEVHSRLSRVVVMHGPALNAIRTQDGPNTLVYADPPYMLTTRSSIGEYGDHEMSDQDHAELLDVLLHMQGRFMLSGYHSDLYDSWATRHGFNCHEFVIDNKAASGCTKSLRTECLWTNF